VDPSLSVAVWDALLAETSIVRTGGGYWDMGRLIERVGSRYPLRLDANRRYERFRRAKVLSTARLIEQWRAVGLDENQATALALDESVGTIPEPQAAGVVVLVGELGSGKSVAGERIHQNDLDAHLGDR
jgi:hypothetical protein